MYYSCLQLACFSAFHFFSPLSTFKPFFTHSKITKLYYTGSCRFLFLSTRLSTPLLVVVGLSPLPSTCLLMVLSCHLFNTWSRGRPKAGNTGRPIKSRVNLLVLVHEPKATIILRINRHATVVRPTIDITILRSRAIDNNMFTQIHFTQITVAGMTSETNAGMNTFAPPPVTAYPRAMLPCLS
jgi:hypothetical protein